MVSKKQKSIDICISDEILVQFFNDDVDKKRKKIIETHLDECNLCLLKLRQFALIEFQLNNIKNREVPQSLVQTVTNSLSLKKVETSSDSVTGAVSLVVKFVKSGIKILEESVLPQNIKLAFNNLSTPTLVLRGETEAKESEVILEQTFTDKGIVATMGIKKIKGNEADINIRLIEFNMPVSKARISLKQQDAIIYSKKTDDNGSVNFKYIRPDHYTIWIGTKNIEWSIDVKIESDR